MSAAGDVGQGYRDGLNYLEMVRLAQQVGMNNPALMAAIGMAESSGVVSAANPSGASGLWQILPSAWPMFNVARLRSDPVYNAQAAKYVLDHQGVNAWSAFTNGSYKRFMNAAGAVGAGVGGVTGGGNNILKQGSTGPYVSLLQNKLGIVADGIYGPNTANAVRAFQSAHGLTVDGIVGPQTTAAMFHGGAASAAGGGGGAPSNNGYVWPTNVRTITSGFGVNRGNHMHGGIDIGAPAGAPIFAATNGRVITSKADPGGFGWYVQVQAPDGTITTYGHMYPNQTYVHVGQTVSAGQKIALVGANGDSTGPHLHFEVSQGGNRVDPAAWLNGKGAGDPGAGVQGTPWDRDSIAAAFGMAATLFDSDPELSGVLTEIEKEGLTPDTAAGKARFQALLMQTNWYRNHSAKQREFLTLEKADPAEAKQRFLAALSDVMTISLQMGVAMNTNEQWRLARTVAEYGLTGSELKIAIAHQFKKNQDAAYGGDIGAQVNKLRAMAADYGYPVSNDELNRVAGQIIGKTEDSQTALTNWENALRKYAKGMFPALAPAIDGGQTVRQAADPYLTVYGNTLEIDPQSIDLARDQTIRKALNQVGPATGTVSRPGVQDNTTVKRPTTNNNTSVPHTTQTDNKGEPQLQPLWQFEQGLKQDPRWLKTKDASNSLAAAGTKVLKDFGLVATQ